MNNKELLYKKLNALRLEVDSSIVVDIKSTVDAVFQEQNLQQCNVSGSLPLIEGAIKTNVKRTVAGLMAEPPPPPKPRKDVSGGNDR